MSASLVGSEMCIRHSTITLRRRYHSSSPGHPALGTAHLHARVFGTSLPLIAREVGPLSSSLRPLAQA
eukprot:6491717-Alexandrium_andersonii.AAC.1